MSTFSCPLVEFTLEKHPNADLLSVAHIKGWQAVVKTEDFINETLGVYVPIDAVADEGHPLLGFLKGKRVKTCKLRQVISQGVLLPWTQVQIYLQIENYSLCEFNLGDDLAPALKISKYIPKESLHRLFGGQICSLKREDWPEEFVKYTDIENINNWPDIIQEGEPVYISEKLHGTSVRLGLIDNQLYLGTRNTVLKLDVDEKQYSIWHKVFYREKLDEVLRNASKKTPHINGFSTDEIILFGEIVGLGIQDLSYGITEPTFVLYDVKLKKDGYFQYLDYSEFVFFAICNEIKRVPWLYSGPYNKDLLQLRHGKDTFSDSHVREGIVIKPVLERQHQSLGRVALKLHSEEYLLRHGATDR